MLELIVEGSAEADAWEGQIQAAYIARTPKIAPIANSLPSVWILRNGLSPMRSSEILDRSELSKGLDPSARRIDG
jgi:hypothetical protein